MWRPLALICSLLLFCSSSFKPISGKPFGLSLPERTPPTGRPPAIAATEFQSYPAYIFHHDAASALVVPGLGRVMAFGIGSKSTFKNSTFNWLWNNTTAPKAGMWQNWGGEKTWLAPQSAWPQIAGRKWPPDANWTKVVKSEVQTGGILQTISAASPHSGIRFIKHYGHDENGQFFVRQTAEKRSGKPLQAALWSVVQINPPDAVFFLLQPKSTIAKSIRQSPGDADPHLRQKGNLACYIPRDHASLKFDIDTTAPALAALRGNRLFVLHAKAQDATYPGPTEQFPKGFPLAIFDTGVRSQRYLELEFYSPLRPFHRGSAWTFTVNWNIHTLSTSDLDAPQLWKEVEQILKSSTSDSSPEVIVH